MILFDFECEGCEKVEERLSEGDEFCGCGKPMKKIISKSGASYDRGYERRRFPYYDECLDKTIRSSQHKEEVLNKMGLVQTDGFFSRGGVKREKRGVIYG